MAYTSAEDDEDGLTRRRARCAPLTRCSLFVHCLALSFAPLSFPSVQYQSNAGTLSIVSTFATGVKDWHMVNTVFSFDRRHVTEYNHPFTVVPQLPGDSSIVSPEYKHKSLSPPSLPICPIHISTSSLHQEYIAEGIRDHTEGLEDERSHGGGHAGED